MELARSFDTNALANILDIVDTGEGNVHHETALTRALWEITFYDHVQTSALKLSELTTTSPAIVAPTSSDGRTSRLHHRLSSTLNLVSIEALVSIETSYPTDHTGSSLRSCCDLQPRMGLVCPRTGSTRRPWLLTLNSKVPSEVSRENSTRS